MLEPDSLAILDAIPANVAIIDLCGVIVCVNRRWQSFALDNGGSKAAELGASYLDVLEKCAGDPDGAAAYQGLQGCLSGLHTHFTHEYDCHSTTQRRWFRFEASRLTWAETTLVAAMHFDITDVRLAREEAFQKEARLQMTLEAGNIGSWEWDIQSGRSYWNPQEYLLLGLPPGDGEVDTALFFDHVHPEDRADLEAELRLVLAQGEEFQRNFRVIRSDGAVRWISGRGRLLRDDKTAKPRRMLGVNIDISDAKEAQLALENSEERLRLLVEGVQGLALMALNPQGTVTFWNSGAQEVFGYLSEEALGQNISFVYPHEPSEPEDGATRELEEAASTGIAQCRGWRLRKDGRLRWMDCTTTPLRDKTGALRGFSRLVRDITEQARAEEALKSVVAHSVDAIVTIDARGRILACEGAFGRLFGYKLTEVLGSNVSQLMPDPWRSQHDSYLENYQRTRVANVIGQLREVVGQRKDGSTFPLELTVTELRLQKEVSYIGILRDLTARKLFEAQLLQGQKMEAIGVLAGGIAHDFNNLLTVIKSCSELILVGAPESLPQSQRELVLEIIRAGERAASLTGRLLAFSRQQNYAPAVVNLKEVVENMETLLKRVIPADIQLHTEFRPDALPVRCDPHQIEQVLMNLVVNARDVLPRGGEILLAVAPHPYDQQLPPGVKNKLYVALSVRDSGCGMSPELQARMFEPFFTTKGPDQGTGLGLAIVYGIAKQNGGFVQVVSAIGEGTKISVMLPSVSETVPTAAPSLAQEASAAQEVAAGKGDHNILLVEDEPAVRKLVGQILRLEGYRVTSVSCGKEALAHLESSRELPDLLLTDVVMPGMSGLELGNRLRERLPELKIVFMSGYAEHVMQREVAPTPCQFVGKPFSRAELCKQVAQALSCCSPQPPR